MRIWQYALMVFLGGCSYGALSTVVKIAYAAGFSSSEVAGSQYLFGVIMSWCVYAFISKKEKVSVIQALKLIASGLPFGLTGIFYYHSLQTLDASLAIIFLFQFVWVGAILDWLVNKVKPSRKKLLSIAILLSGSVLATNLVARQDISFSTQGMLWGLLSSVTFATFILVSGTVQRQVTPALRSAFFCTGALITVFSLTLPVALLSPSALLAVAPYGLFLGFFGVVLPPLLFSIGMPHVGPSLGTMLSASELPVAVCLSALVLSEHVTIMQWAGVLIILAAIASTNLSFRKKHSHARI